MLSGPSRASSITRAGHARSRHSFVSTDAWLETRLPTIEAASEEPPRRSINSDRNSAARLIKPTSAQDDQLRNILPSHLPRFRHIQNYAELGFYIDRSQYTISVGSGPVDDLHYGIIVVSFGEEHVLFRSERDESREVQVPLAAVDEVQPRIITSASSVATKESFIDELATTTLSRAHAPPLQRT